MMPTIPTSTTQASPISKRAPASEFATRSPMSTNPPMAVRIPSVIPNIFRSRCTAVHRLLLGGLKAVVELLKLVRKAGERPGDQRQPFELTPAGGDAHVGQDRRRPMHEIVKLVPLAVGRA